MRDGRVEDGGEGPQHMHYVAEQFTPEEEATLRPYFTNLDPAT